METSEHPSFRIGSPDSDHVVVRPRITRDAVGVSRGTDPDDGNWVSATIEIVAGAFRARIDAMLRVDDFVRFRDEVRLLNEDLSGTATFDTMEGWLRIEVQGDGRGHLRAGCEAVDSPGTGNRLAFAIALDQTDLPAIVRDLDAVCQEAPVVGAR
jgi:hypothetical protein